MSSAVSVTTSDAESVEPAASHGNSHVTSKLLPVMLDHLTYKDNEFNSDGDGSDHDDDGDDDDDGSDGAAADDGVFQAMNVYSTKSVMPSTTASFTSTPTDNDAGDGAAADGVSQVAVKLSTPASLISSLPEQALSTTTNSSHSMTVRPHYHSSCVSYCCCVSCFMTVALHFCLSDFSLRRDFSLE